MLPTLVSELCITSCMALQGQPLYNKLFWGLTPRSSEISVRPMIVWAGCLKLPCFIRSTKAESGEELNSFSLSQWRHHLFCSQGTLEKSPLVLPHLSSRALPGLCQSQASLLRVNKHTVAPCSNQEFGGANPDCCPRNCELLGKVLATLI